MSKNLIKIPRSQIVEISNILLALVHSLPNLTLSHHTCQLLLKMKRFKSDFIKVSDENDAHWKKNSVELCPKLCRYLFTSWEEDFGYHWKLDHFTRSVHIESYWMNKHNLHWINLGKCGPGVRTTWVSSKISPSSSSFQFTRRLREAFPYVSPDQQIWSRNEG